MLIELTDERGEKFFLQAALIERITTRQFRGGSEIYLTTGRWVECIETPEYIAEAIKEAE